MVNYSILDLCPVNEDGSAQQSLANSVALAQLAQRQGFKRYWLAEHHNMEGIASAATAVVIGHIASKTQGIRVGSGGIMLPNHSPIQVAEQFGTLETLYPGRIDLGLGRAPGTDPLTTRALRRNLKSSDDQFPQDVMELLNYFKPVSDGQKVRAVPGAGLNIPVWILGSSLFGAQLAAALGLPFAFASHFAPADLAQAIAIYRRQFKASEYLDKPYIMAGLTVIAAATDDEAQYQATSLMQSFVNLRKGTPGKFKPPMKHYFENLNQQEQFILNQVLSCAAIGSANTIRQKINEFITQTQVDEIILTGSLYNHELRMQSFEIASTMIQSLNS